MQTRGPVISIQKGLWLNGVEFKIFKFRKMINESKHAAPGVFTNVGDIRITNAGSFLRKISFDELPQLLNIINVTMSAIGPQAPVIYHPHAIEDYPQKYNGRFKVRLGIPGLAQVNGRSVLLERPTSQTSYDQIMKRIIDA